MVRNPQAKRGARGEGRKLFKITLSSGLGPPKRERGLFVSSDEGKLQGAPKWFGEKGWEGDHFYAREEVKSISGTPYMLDGKGKDRQKLKHSMTAAKAKGLERWVVSCPLDQDKQRKL